MHRTPAPRSPRAYTYSICRMMSGKARRSHRHAHKRSRPAPTRPRLCSLRAVSPCPVRVCSQHQVNPHWWMCTICQRPAIVYTPHLTRARLLEIGKIPSRVLFDTHTLSCARTRAHKHKRYVGGEPMPAACLLSAQSQSIHTRAVHIYHFFSFVFCMFACVHVCMCR